MSRRTVYSIGCVVLSVIPFLAPGCSKPSAPETAIESRDGSADNDDSLLELKLRTAEEKLKLKAAEYDSLVREKDELAAENDKLTQERNEYPRKTPDDVIDENKSLRDRLWRQNTVQKIGYRELIGLLDEVEDLRNKNLALTRNYHGAKRVLENRGIYLDEIGKEIDPSENPWALEKAAHASTKRKSELYQAQADQARAERDADRIRNEIQIYELKTKIIQITSQRDDYKKIIEQYKEYYLSTQNPRK